jgi:hypothetical protein
MILHIRSTDIYIILNNELPMFSIEKSEARGRKIIIRPPCFRLAKHYFILYKIVEHTKLFN